MCKYVWGELHYWVPFFIYANTVTAKYRNLWSNIIRIEIHVTCTYVKIKNDKILKIVENKTRVIMVKIRKNLNLDA